MAIVINGSGTVTGLAVGGLPDGTVDAGTLATDSVDSAELVDGSIDTAHIAADQITSAILPAGSVLQVVTAESQTAATTTGTAWAASAITASITPSATSSKVLVLANFYISTSTTTTSNSYTIFQDGSTNLGNGTYGFGSFYGAAAETQGSINVVSSPSTTSAVEYKVYFNRRDGAGTSTCGVSNRKSVITLMEIAG
jgi:hypothetical protein